MLARRAAETSAEGTLVKLRWEALSRKNHKTKHPSAAPKGTPPEYDGEQRG